MWDLALKSEYINPVLSLNGNLYVGPIWYAFYGYKGAPIFEGHSTEKRAECDVVKMKHDGRFRKSTNIDGVVFSFKSSTIALENPCSKKPIPNWFWEKLLKVPWFQIENSRINWPDKSLLKLIELETEKIKKLGELPLYKW